MSGIGDILVSVFSQVAPTAPQNDVRRDSEYKSAILRPIEMPLKEFLMTLPNEYLQQINTVRSTADKKARAMLKQTTLPAATIAAVLNSRTGSMTLQEKIKKYNGLVVLDFDDVDNLNEAKEKLSKISYIYYIGISVSGNGLFAIVKTDNDDFNFHRQYFESLCAEMKKIGLNVDKSGSDVTRLRIVSYDSEAYVNDRCIDFCLPDCIKTNISDEHDDEDDIHRKISLYVETWEKMKIPLDDYGDWLMMAMSLSGLGETGLGYLNRISRFSQNYDEKENRKKYEELAKNTRNVGLGTFFYKCNCYGVIPEKIPHYEIIPFPIEVLPEKVRKIILQTNKCLNFPIDYIAPALLFATCAACGNAVVVQIINGWQEKAILYLAIVGERGTNKTSCFEFALAPLKKKDDIEYEKYSKALIIYENELRKPLKERKTDTEEPLYCQTILSDFTAEVLVKLHTSNPRGLLVFYDELIGFIMNFNKYRNGSDEQMWTQLFTGGSITVNRVSSAPIKIDNTCISVIGGIQPGILKEFAKGKIQNGFVDRWIFAFPDRIPYPKLNENEIDRRTLDNWETIINKILNIPYKGAPKVLKFTTEAKAAYTAWYNNLSDQKNAGGSSFAGLAAKMDRYCGRFALALEMLKYGCGESKIENIGLESVRGAIALCYYFIGCSLKARKYFSTSPLADLNNLQKKVYADLPISFETGQGVEIAVADGMPERTFKRWLTTRYFKQVRYGQYEKAYH